MFIRFFSILVILNLIFVPLSQAQIDLPAYWIKETKIDRKQYTFTGVRITKDGEVTAKSRYSNAKKIDGDHFITLVVVFGPDNTPIFGLQYWGGLNSTLGGSTKERTVVKRGNLDPNLVPYIEWVGVKHGKINTKNDQQVIAKYLASAAVGYFAGVAFAAHATTAGATATEIAVGKIIVDKFTGDFVYGILDFYGNAKEQSEIRLTGVKFEKAENSARSETLFNCLRWCQTNISSTKRRGGGGGGFLK